jgi:hypothetical protein
VNDLGRHARPEAVKRVCSGSNLSGAYRSKALNKHFYASQLSDFFLLIAGSNHVGTARETT